MAKAKKVAEKKEKKTAAKPTPAKKPVAKKPVAKKKTDEKKSTGKKKKDEKVEIIEDEEKVYKPKQKPKLTKETKRLLNIKAEQSKKMPKFRRQEWFRYKRLGEKWRKPRGLHSKMRTNRKYRPNMVSIGYRTPKAVRGYHPSGFKEVLVYNPRDLKDIDSKTQAGHSVGTRKREEIIKSADKLEIRVLNRGV